jgi:Flp pilus assembly CpaF family ATPase
VKAAAYASVAYGGEVGSVQAALMRATMAADDNPYPVRSLSRHVLVAGTTGSGKTNTIMALLEASDRGEAC